MFCYKQKGYSWCNIVMENYDTTITFKRCTSVNAYAKAPSQRLA